jgi:hypothetical protein
VAAAAGSAAAAAGNAAAVAGSAAATGNVAAACGDAGLVAYLSGWRRKRSRQPALQNE